MNAADNLPFVRQMIDSADAGNENVDRVLRNGCRARPAGIGRATAGLAQTDRLVTKARRYRQPVPVDRILSEKRPGLRGTDTGVLTAPRAPRRERHLPTGHRVDVVVLEPVFFIFMVAHRKLEIMREIPCDECRSEDGLDAGRIVFAIVVANADLAGGSLQNGIFGSIRDGIRNDAGNACPRSEEHTSELQS